MKPEEFLLQQLDRYINKSVVDDNYNFYLIKELVGKVKNMKIEIYSNDHNPPHFHVKSDDMSIDATFRLDNGELIYGNLKRKDRIRIENFYKNEEVQKMMKEMWNKSKTENKKVD